MAGVHNQIAEGFPEINIIPEMGLLDKSEGFEQGDVAAIIRIKPGFDGVQTEASKTEVDDGSHGFDGQLPSPIIDRHFAANFSAQVLEIDTVETAGTNEGISFLAHTCPGDADAVFKCLARLFRQVLGFFTCTGIVPYDEAVHPVAGAHGLNGADVGILQFAQDQPPCFQCGEGREDNRIQFYLFAASIERGTSKVDRRCQSTVKLYNTPVRQRMFLQTVTIHSISMNILPLLRTRIFRNNGKC
jgi:hypothetical protein